MGTLERNQGAFTAQSEGFSSDGETYADQGDLEWMLAELPLGPGMDALDIATGTGELARALAPRVASVIGLDATPAMLEKGRSFIQEHAIENISFQEGRVEEIPFESERFDAVTCRYAFHHFADPRPVISEMARVCKKGGHVLIVDIVVLEESTRTEANYYEWLCDQSHTRCCGVEEVQTLYGLMGLEVVASKDEIIEEKVANWLDFSMTEKGRREELLHALAIEMEGGARTGLAPFKKGAELYFRQREAVILGRKR